MRGARCRLVRSAGGRRSGGTGAFHRMAPQPDDADLGAVMSDGCISRMRRAVIASGGDHIAVEANREIPMPPQNSSVPSVDPQQTPRPIDPGVRIGHAHLKVADLERALAFYCGVLGFEVTQRLGKEAAFLAAGGYHHHIGLNTWESKGGGPPAPGTTGLFHVAILYPTRAALADALRRLLAAGVPLEGASDHGVSEALYLRDPDGNGIELYRDREPEHWPRDGDGHLAMHTRRLDLDGLLREAA